MEIIRNLLAGLRQSCAELLDLPFDFDFETPSSAKTPAIYRISGAMLLIILFGIFAFAVAFFAKILLPPVGAAAVFAVLMMVIFEVKDSGKASRNSGKLFAGWSCGKFNSGLFSKAEDDPGVSETESAIAFWLLGLIKFLLFAYICYSGKISLIVACFAADILMQLWLIYADQEKSILALRVATAIAVIVLMIFQTQVVFFAAVGIFFFFRALRKKSALSPEGITLAGNISGWIVLLLALVFAA